jgi:hypothetical protein
MNSRPRPGEFKHKFTSADDARLCDVVQRLGTKDWNLVATQMYPRTARQCRERWNNYINPVIEHIEWTPEEDLLLDEKYAQLGAKWKVIASFFPTRSKNMVKYRCQRRQRSKAGGKAAQRTSEGARNDSSASADRGSIWTPIAFQSSVDPALWDDITLGFL